MKLILMFIASILAIKSCNMDSIGNGKRGDGKVESIEIPVTDYWQINNLGPGDIVYEQKADTAPYCRLEIDHNLIASVSIEAKNGVLKVSKIENINPTVFKIYTNSKELKLIENSGSGDILLNGAISGEELNIEMKGSGDFTAHNLNSTKLSVNLEGSSDIRLGGSTSEGSISIKGSGDIDAYALVAKNMLCSIHGAGDAKLNVTDSLKIKIHGSGDVKYKGAPAHISQSVKGSGSISAE